MTLLGKIFVMFNVAVSLFMAFAAFALYANGIDWGYDVARPGTQGGLIKEKQEEIKEFQSAQYATENAWRSARSELWAIEEARRDDRAFYVKNLQHLRTTAKDGDPAMMVVMVNSLPERDPANKNRPKMKVAKVRGDRADEDILAPLYSRTYYQVEYKKNLDQNIALLEKLEKETTKDIILTSKMLDVAQMADRKLFADDPKDDQKEPFGLRGLRTLLVDEREKREGVLREMGLTRPLYVNTSVESELIFKRNSALKARIEELNAYIAKRKLDGKLTKR